MLRVGQKVTLRIPNMEPVHIGWWREYVSHRPIGELVKVTNDRYHVKWRTVRRSYVYLHRIIRPAKPELMVKRLKKQYTR